MGLLQLQQEMQVRGFACVIPPNWMLCPIATCRYVALDVCLLLPRFERKEIPFFLCVVHFTTLSVSESM